MPRKLTKKQCREIKLDEKKAVKYYRKLGFPKQAADEARHLKFFEGQCDKLK